MTRTRFLALFLLASGSPATLAAQQASPANPDTQQQTPAENDEGDGSIVVDYDAAEEIVVTAAPIPGQVVGDIEPELTLDPADIRAYGVSSINELLTELEPLTGSGRGRGGGRPVILLNGRRIGSFSELRDLPTEAILRVDILPEEVALTYGYRADQRVVNFVLRPRFRSYAAEVEGRVPTAGGSSNGEVEATIVRINRDGRFNLDLEYERDSNLLESERDIVASPGRSPFDLAGNVTGIDGGEIDPALSAAAGEPVTIAGVPNADPAFGDFVGTAGIANATDTTPYRTLRPAQQRLSANAVLSRTIFGDVAATGTLRVEKTDSTALLGLPGYSLLLPADNPYSPFANDVMLYRYAGTDPLRRDSDRLETEASFSLNGDIPGDWFWTVTGNYSRIENDSRTERGVDAGTLQDAVTAGDPGVNPFGPVGAGLAAARLYDTADSIATDASLNALVNGSLFELPAGDASTSFRAGVNTLGQDSRSVRSGVVTTTDIGRTRGNAQANLELPITSRRNGVLDAIGDLSLNANAEIEQLSDFGTLSTLGYGVRWSPIDDVRLIVSMTHEDGAPSPGQLGNPLVATPNVRVFDYVRGETVDITRLDGGNPGLAADSRRVFSAGLRVKPFEDPDLTLTADYTNIRIDDPIAEFPAATAEIEAAFPDRFVRDATGRLVQIDNRPINFQSSEREELRWGFHFSKSIESTLPRRRNALREAGLLPERERGGEAQAGEGADRPRGGGRGRGFGRRGGGGGGRLSFSLRHTIALTNRVTIRDGLPVLDLLDGSATGSSGGQSRHEIRARGGWSRDGIGFRLSAEYKSGTEVDGGESGGDTLRFSDLATFELDAWVDLGSQPELLVRAPWLRGARVSFEVENIFDARQRVTDANGTVPLSYQPGYLDPLGRTVRISFRKLFLPGRPDRGALSGS